MQGHIRIHQCAHTRFLWAAPLYDWLSITIYGPKRSLVNGRIITAQTQLSSYAQMPTRLPALCLALAANLHLCLYGFFFPNNPPS